MCNKYTIEVLFDELWRRSKATRDITNRANPSQEAYPDRVAPVVRNTPDGEREIANLTWGMPSPSFVTKGKPDYGVTNIRNVESPHWRRWLDVQNRCLVPWTAFIEWEDTKPKKTERQFVIDPSKPLAFFAGIWTPWKGERGSQKNPRAGEHELFGFLTCEANAVVKPIHAKAMPVLLTSEADIDLWMTAEWDLAKVLQRPYPKEAMAVLPPATTSTEPLLI